jgi:MYXO-CTERM domain-containing protein
VLSQSYAGTATSLSPDFNDLVDNLATAAVNGSVTIDVDLSMTSTGGAFGVNFVVGVAAGADDSPALDTAAAAGGTNTTEQSQFNPVSAPVTYSMGDSADALVLAISEDNPTDAPEPASIGVFGLAVAALGALRRRRQRLVRA